MKIINLIASVDPAGGGPVEGLKLSSEIMRGWGHETEIVTLDDQGESFVGSFPFPVHGCGPSYIKGRFVPKFVPWIKRNAHRFDAAIIHGLWNWASIGGWMGLRKTGLPYVIFSHGMMDPWFRQTYPLKHMAKQAVWLLWQGKALRDAQAVLFTCEEERRLARGVFWGHGYRERVVSFGSADPPAGAERQSAVFRQLIPELGDRRFLLFLSRIHPKKGCDLLVDAFAKIAFAYPDVDLVIAGPDEVGWKEKLIEQATKSRIDVRIHWPGMLTGDAKWGAFRAAEAFILPSHQENFGIVVAEAMSCGTPVLITDKVNIWREVDACGGGIVDEDNATGIERLLQKWLTMTQQEKIEMAGAARGGFEKHFQAEAAAHDLAEILKDISRKT